MARTQIAPQQVGPGGVVLAATAIDQANGMYLQPFDPRLRLHILNSSGGSGTATLRAHACPKCGFTTDQVVTVAAGAEEIVEGLPGRCFGGADGALNLDFSGGFTGTVYAEPPL